MNIFFWIFTSLQLLAIYSSVKKLYSTRSEKRNNTGLIAQIVLSLMFILLVYLAAK